MARTTVECVGDCTYAYTSSVVVLTEVLLSPTKEVEALAAEAAAW